MHAGAGFRAGDAAGRMDLPGCLPERVLPRKYLSRCKIVSGNISAKFWPDDCRLLKKITATFVKQLANIRQEPRLCPAVVPKIEIRCVDERYTDILPTQLIDTDHTYTLEPNDYTPPTMTIVSMYGISETVSLKKKLSWKCVYFHGNILHRVEAFTLGNVARTRSFEA